MNDPINLPKIGFLRLPSILAPQGPIPVSKSSWYAGIKIGRYPKPVKLGPRTSAWRAEQIWELIQDPADVDFREKPADDVNPSSEFLERVAGGAQRDSTSPSTDRQESEHDEEDDDDEPVISRLGGQLK